jgi:putative spermidine/putrescine transport system permease protein
MNRFAPWLVLVLVFTFLIAPFSIVFITALSNDNSLVFPPQSYSGRWIVSVLQTEVFGAALVTSLWVGLAATGIALVLGVPAAYALQRYRLPETEWVRLALTSPLIIPGLVIGVALLRQFVLLQDGSVDLALLLGHTALVLPYAVRVVGASLVNLPKDIEDAAFSLGANRFLVFWRVVLPNIRGGLAAATVLAFITSFNHVPVSLFLTGPGVTTLPIRMLLHMESTYDPSIAALSALLIIFSTLFVLATERLLGLSRYI